MKIDFSDIKITPPNMDFGLCVYGAPNDKVQSWINYWNLPTSPSGTFTNIDITNHNTTDIFNIPKSYKYMDGFSPNLNKHLHIGHLSNFIMAKSLKSLGVGHNAIAILGDTLEGSVEHNEALKSFKDLAQKFGYYIHIYYASEQKLKDTNLLTDGTKDYEGTKVFTLKGGSKIVGIKANDSTTYFYQDVALAELLGDSTLYVTGLEQENHFNNVSQLIKHEIKHLGLGLVLNDGKKMSSSEGNVILLDEIFEILQKEFSDDYLNYNILAGTFLKYSPNSNKNIKLKELSDPKKSEGLYLSYTLAKLWSAGLEIDNDVELKGKLKFMYWKSYCTLDPSILLKELHTVAKKINQLYLTNIIKGSTENQKIFKKLGDQLASGMNKLGMYNVKKV